MDNIKFIPYKGFGIQCKEYVDKYISKEVAIEKYSKESLYEDEAVIKVDNKGK